MEQHQQWQQDEADIVLRDKNNQDATTGGLFRGAFSRPGHARFDPLHDAIDGVDRCPACFWELEDGFCASCGHYANDSLDDEMIDDFYGDSDDDLEPDHERYEVHPRTGEIIDIDTGDTVAMNLTEFNEVFNAGRAIPIVPVGEIWENGIRPPSIFATHPGLVPQLGRGRAHQAFADYMAGSSPNPRHNEEEDDDVDVRQ